MCPQSHDLNGICTTYYRRPKQRADGGHLHCLRCLSVAARPSVSFPRSCDTYYRDDITRGQGDRENLLTFGKGPHNRRGFAWVFIPHCPTDTEEWTTTRPYFSAAGYRTTLRFPQQQQLAVRDSLSPGLAHAPRLAATRLHAAGRHQRKQVELAGVRPFQQHDVPQPVDRFRHHGGKVTEENRCRRCSESIESPWGDVVHPHHAYPPTAQVGSAVWCECTVFVGQSFPCPRCWSLAVCAHHSGTSSHWRRLSTFVLFRTTRDNSVVVFLHDQRPNARERVG